MDAHIVEQVRKKNDAFRRTLIAGKVEFCEAIPLESRKALLEHIRYLRLEDDTIHDDFTFDYGGARYQAHIDYFDANYSETADATSNFMKRLMTVHLD
jgi:hypothetical protein